MMDHAPSLRIDPGAKARKQWAAWSFFLAPGPPLSSFLCFGLVCALACRGDSAGRRVDRSIRGRLTGDWASIVDEAAPAFHHRLHKRADRPAAAAAGALHRRRIIPSHHPRMHDGGPAGRWVGMGGAAWLDARAANAIDRAKDSGPREPDPPSFGLGLGRAPHFSLLDGGGDVEPHTRRSDDGGVDDLWPPPPWGVWFLFIFTT